MMGWPGFSGISVGGRGEEEEEEDTLSECTFPTGEEDDNSSSSEEMLESTFPTGNDEPDNDKKDQDQLGLPKLIRTDTFMDSPLFFQEDETDEKEEEEDGPEAKKARLALVNRKISSFPKCDRCPKQFFSDRLLEKHKIKVHYFPLALASGNVGWIKYLKYKHQILSKRQEILEKRAGSAFPCTLCDKVFLRRNNLRSHLFFIHFRVDKTYQQLLEEAVRARENEPSSTSPPKDQNIDYNDQSTDENDDDDDDNDDPDQAAEDTPEKEEELIVPPPPMLQKCEHCGYTVPTDTGIKDMIRHILTNHAKKTNFACQICGKNFKTSSDLIKHKLGEHEKRNFFKCEPCRVFYTKFNSLVKHNSTIHNQPTAQINNH